MEEIRLMEYFKKETHLRGIINISQKMFKEMRRIIIKEEQQEGKDRFKHKKE